MFINRQPNKEDMVHIYNGIFLCRKKNEVLLVVITWYYDHGIITWSDRERQTMYDFTYMWNLRKKQLSKTETDS